MNSENIINLLQDARYYLVNISDELLTKEYYGIEECKDSCEEFQIQYIRLLIKSLSAEFIIDPESDITKELYFKLAKKINISYLDDYIVDDDLSVTTLNIVLINSNQNIIDQIQDLYNITDNLQDQIDYILELIANLDLTTSFIELTDTPDDYLGQAGKVPTVKQSEDGLEFTDFPEAETITSVVSDVTVGAINAGDSIPLGTNIQELVDLIFSKIFYPTFTAPSLGTINPVAREIGSSESFQVTLPFNRGAITGNTIGGIWNPSANQGFRSGPAISSSLDYKGTIFTDPSGLVLNVSGVPITAGANNATATVNYSQGPQPLDSKGNNYQTPLPAGIINKVFNLANGYYYNFYGYGIIPTNSSEVRGMQNRTFNTTFSIVIPAGQTEVAFAYPASRPDIVNSSVKYVEGFNSDVGDIFTKSSFSVNDGGGNPVTYKIYTVTFPAPESATVTYNVTIP